MISDLWVPFLLGLVVGAGICASTADKRLAEHHWKRGWKDRGEFESEREKQSEMTKSHERSL